MKTRFAVCWILASALGAGAQNTVPAGPERAPRQDVSPESLVPPAVAPPAVAAPAVAPAASPQVLASNASAQHTAQRAAVPGAVARVMVGLEQTAAGAASPVQKIAVSFFFSEPLTERAATWGSLRLSSMPLNLQSTLVSLPADLGKIATELPVNELVRSGEFLVGVSYRVSSGRSPWSQLMLIASEGAAMPLAPAADRFYREYYGGVRVQSMQHTHMVDVALGQNEAVTGGRFRGAVLRVDSFYALPVPGGTFLYLFGTAMVRASPRAAGTGSGRDSYRIGVAVDVIQMLKALRTN